MKKRYFVLLSGLIFLMAGGLLAQTDEQVFADFNQLEDRIFQLKNSGQYNKALDSLIDGILDLIRIHSVASKGGRAELEARGEIYLEFLFAFAQSTARYKDVADFLVEKIPIELPHLHALSSYHRMRFQLNMGNLDSARALKKELGYIDRWHLVGPFDNERGGGFDRAFGPEEKLDLDAAYEGKERTVSWRKNPCEPPDGYINLNALFNPDDQCLAYALAVIDSESEKDAALRLGSDEAVKVFFNGRELLKSEARRLHHFDQDVIGVRLQKGLNTLLLKVCDQTGPWGFSARLTNPDGGALAGYQILDDLTGKDLPAAQTGPSPNVEVSRGALAHFEKRANEGYNRAHFYLGYLHHVREYKGEDEGLATQNLNAFILNNPEHVYGHFLRALTEARRFDILAEKDDNKWRAGLERTLALDPDNVEAHVLLGSHYLTTLMIPDEALSHARTALEKNQGYLPASYLLADVYKAKGMNARSLKAIEALSHAPENLKYPKLRLRLGDVALSFRRPQKAKEHWRAALEVDFLFQEARTRLLDAVSRAGDVAAAKALLLDRIAINPYHTHSMKHLATMALGEEEPNEAITWLTQTLMINPEDDMALKGMGEANHMMGREEDALVFYKQALEINPKAKHLRRYVEFLFEDEKPFEDNYEVDVLALVAAYPPGENPENDSHEYLLLQDVIKVNVDGTSSHYHHRIVRILNHQGAKIFDYFATFYTPGEQRCRIKKARIIHPDGRIEEAKIDNTERRGDPQYGGRAPAFVDLPPLGPGDVVDVDFRKDDLKQSFFGDYFGHRHFFQRGDLKAVKDSRLTLILPKEREFYFNKRGFEFQPEMDPGEGKDYEIRTWTLSDLPKVNYERNMPGQMELTPCLEISTYASWDEFGQWWWNLVEEQCDITDEMRSKVAELTEGLETEREKIRAVYNFVVSDIRYNDTWEFGVHGFKPYRASVIYTNRFGDCKDKSILMKALLGEVGIEAFPVLIRLSAFRSKEDLTLPLVSHFNHAISYVPEIDGGPGLFLDGTAQYHTMDTLPPPDQGATVFVVENGPGNIVTIPYESPESNSRHNAYDVTVGPDGSASIALRHESRGIFETMIRSNFLNPGRRKTILEKTYGQIFGDLVVEELDFPDMEDLTIPAHYRAKIEVKDFLLKSGDRSQLRSKFFPTKIGSMATEDERRFDMLLGAPYTLRTTINYILPEGYGTPEPPADTVLENDFADFSLTYETGEKGQLTVKHKLTLKTPRVSSLEYPIFREFCREVDRAEERLIQISKNQ